MVALGVLFAIAVAGVNIYEAGQLDLDDPAQREQALTIWAGAATVLLAGATLYYVVPKPAQLHASSDVLPHVGLSFRVREERGKKVPREVRINIHLAVANVGDESALLWRSALVYFLDIRGDAVPLRQVLGREYDFAFQHEAPSGRQSRNTTSRLGPWMLGGGDLCVVSFRDVVALEWGKGDDLMDARRMAYLLERPITHAVIEVAWRRGRAAKTRTVRQKVDVAGQMEYLAALTQLTNGLTEYPEGVDYRPVRQFESRV